MTLYVGKTILAFDNRLWRKNGGDSKNDDFYREARIVKIHPEPDNSHAPTPLVIDIQFIHDGRIVKSVFASAVKSNDLTEIKKNTKLSDKHKAVLDKLSDPKEFDALFNLKFEEESGE
jgi:hypothetical protein